MTPPHATPPSRDTAPPLPPGPRPCGTLGRGGPQGPAAGSAAFAAGAHDAPTSPAATPPYEPVGLLRRVALPLGVLGAVVGGFAYVGAVDPNAPGHYPVCPLLYYTGVYCPGCGGLRSAYAVAHGRLGTALGCNALAVVGYAAFAALWTVWLVRAVRGRPFEPGLRPAHRRLLLAVLLAFTVVRNLPFGRALAP